MNGTWCPKSRATVSVSTFTLSSRTPLRAIMEGLKPGWRRACLTRWSLRMKRLSHRGHRKRFSPVWVLMWRASSSERANLLPQAAHEQGNGLSPVQHKHTHRETPSGLYDVRCTTPKLKAVLLHHNYSDTLPIYSLVHIRFMMCP